MHDSSIVPRIIPSLWKGIYDAKNDHAWKAMMSRKIVYENFFAMSSLFQSSLILFRKDFFACPAVNFTLFQNEIRIGQ